MFKAIGISITIIIIFLTLGLAIRGCDKVFTNVENSIIYYEEFQEIYNTTQKLDEDLCVMLELDENDQMFDQFSKQQRITQIKSNLNRWVSEYNAKSRSINRNVWKSESLPHTLYITQFKCY